MKTKKHEIILLTQLSKWLLPVILFPAAMSFLQKFLYKSSAGMKIQKIVLCSVIDI